MNPFRPAFLASFSLSFSLAISGALAGSPTGLVPFVIHDVGPGTTNLRPVVAHAGHLYLAYEEASTHVLVGTDGTVSDVPALVNLLGNEIEFTPPALVGDRLVVEINDPLLGRELYTVGLDLTGLTLIADVDPGEGNGSTLGSGYAVLGDKLIYRGEDATSGDEPWVTDGTAAGTFRLKDIDASADNVDGMPDEQDGFPVAHDGLVYFVGASPGEGRELWVTDGTSAGTQIVADLISGPSDSNPRHMTLWGGVPHFLADDGLGASILYRTDGTSSGTVPVVTLPTAAVQLVEYAGELYFLGFDTAYGHEVWVTDGTPAGTRVLDLIPGPMGSAPEEMIATEMGVVFRNVISTSALYVTDGTLAGTSQLPGVSGFSELVVDGAGTLFFIADSSSGMATIHAASSAFGVADLGIEAARLQATDMGVFWSNGSEYGSATAFTRYGTGSGDSTGGVPSVALSGDATPGGFIELDVTGSTPGAMVALLTGIQSSAIPLGLGGQAAVLVNPFSVHLLGGLPGSGTLSLNAAIPMFFTAGTVFAQAVIEDPAAPSGLGLALTDAVQMNIR